MSIAKIVTIGAASVHVIKTRHGEFVNKLFVNGKRHDSADYFTDDKGDAISTAEAMAKQANQNAQNQNQSVRGFFKSQLENI